VRARGARRLVESDASAAVARNGKAEGTGADAIESVEERTRLLASVDALPARDRLLVRLVYLDGYGYGDVARLLAVPENSISPWLSRAKDRLRAVYGSAAREPLKGRSETP
jgi:RNA polymerase sigma factor (sigma-70 family)